MPWVFFLHVYLCTCVDVKGVCQISWNWGYRCLRDAVWSLGIKLMSLEEKQLLLTTESSLQLNKHFKG